MNVTSASRKISRPLLMFVLVFLGVVSLAFVWSGAGRMLRMQTQAASHAEFARLKADDETKIVVEVAEAPAGSIRGKLLEKQNETHYARTAKDVEAAWGKDTAFVMGKPGDLHRGAVVHVTGKVASDHSVQARQIVILTGYVQVK